MRPVSDKEMDDFFKASFEGFEKAPAPNSWQKIEQHLQQKKSKRFSTAYWAVAASIVLIVAFAVKMYQAESGTIKLIATEDAVDTQPQEVAATHHIENKEPDVEVVQSLAEFRAANEQRFLAMLASSPGQMDSGNLPVAAKVSNGKLFDNRAVANSSETEVFPQEELPKEATETFVADHKEKLVAVEHTVAYHQPAKTEEIKVNKIKSVKDMVNFLVSKVDKRKNKIVYMSKTEESDIEITAINLGLFKYRKEY